MKKLAFLFAMTLGIALKAQTQYQDVIYLKNGTIIKGMITEFVPNVSYTIKTQTDRFLFVKLPISLKLQKKN